MLDKKKNTKFHIGQIVYILSNKQSIIPAMIVEQVTVQTLTGENISWKLAMGAKGNPNKPQKIVDSASINGEIFSSLDEIREVLQAKLSNFIRTIIGQAEERTKSWYGEQPKQKSGESSPKKKVQNQSTSKIDPEDILSDLEQNFVAVEEEPPQQQIEVQRNMPEDLQREDLKQRLKEQLTIEDDETPSSGEKIGYITTPDGKKLPVNLS